MEPTFAKRLRHWLDRAGVTQAELARMVGKDPSTINQWLKGRMTPTHESLIKIAKALGIDLATFFGPLNGDDPAAAAG